MLTREAKRTLLVLLVVALLIGLALSDYLEWIPIPATVWSVAVGSLLTLVGVMVSNDATAERFELQQRFDAGEKAKERIGKIRLEVYLEAIESIIGAGGHIGNLADIDLSKESLLDGQRPLLVAASKVQLVAEPATALLVSSAATSYSQCVFSLLPEAVRIHDLQTDIEIRTSHQKAFQAECQRLLAEMRNQNLSAQYKPDVFKALMSAYEFERGRVEAVSKEIEDLGHQQNQLRLAYLHSVLQQTDRLTEELLAALLALRGDLGMVTDPATYRQGLLDQRARLLSTLEALKPFIDERLDQEATAQVPPAPSKDES